MATGRDEMLRRNQQRNKKRVSTPKRKNVLPQVQGKKDKTATSDPKPSSVPKRKGLMEVLDDYRAEKESGPYAPERNKNVKGPVRSGKAYGQFLEDNIKEARSKPPLVLAPKPEPEPKEKPPETKPKFPNEQANKDKEGNPTGTYGAGRPTGGRGARPVRKNFPAGEKGDKAFAAALKKYGGSAPRPTERSGTPKPKRSDFTGAGASARYNRALERWKKSLSRSSNQNNDKVKIVSAGQHYGGRR